MYGGLGVWGLGGGVGWGGGGGWERGDWKVPTADAARDWNEMFLWKGMEPGINTIVILRGCDRC